MKGLFLLKLITILCKFATFLSTWWLFVSAWGEAEPLPLDSFAWSFGEVSMEFLIALFAFTISVTFPFNFGPMAKADR